MIKTQKRIDDFFNNGNNNNNDYKLKRYFYLNFENKYKPEKEAYWTDKKPEKVNYIEVINCNTIKKGYYFYICGYFDDIKEKEFVLSKEKVYSNISYLKSHLQKNIRKGNENLAIPSAYHLFKLDINELLRRLPIIMLEDVILHESFSTIIWFMIANSNNNFKMKIYMYEWILGLVYVLCKIDVKDKYIDIGEGEGEDENANISIIDKLNNYANNDFSETQCSLLYSIIIRIEYGCNKSDSKMLNDIAHIWYKRFLQKNNNIKVNTLNITPIVIYVKELLLDDWDISAIDYHTNPKILEYINKKYNINIEILKEIIFHHSSNINYRCKGYIYDIKNWNIIKNYVEKTQKYLLNSSY